MGGVDGVRDVRDENGTWLTSSCRYHGGSCDPRGLLWGTFGSCV